MTQSYHKTTLTEQFFKPLVELYSLSDHQRICRGISDFEFLKMGAQRCVSSAKSGNEFLQCYRKQDGDKIGGSHFFEPLKSERGLNQQKSINNLMRPYLKDHLEDELGQIDEFKKWHFVAGDGHYHKAAIFDPKTKAQTSRKDPNRPLLRP